jgi:carbonic anhydrase/acetyltransferase-like protein (isoleucine patch superfamily)
MKDKIYKRDEAKSWFMKKFELVEVNGEVRIRALRDFGSVKAGDVGGRVDGEHNLDHDGDCWIDAQAQVYGDAQVSGNARVSGNAWVYGGARVSGNAWVYGGARVSGDAWVYGGARVSGDAWVYGDAQVSGNARIS